MTGVPDTYDDGMQSEIVATLDAALNNFVQRAVNGRTQVAAATSQLIGMPLTAAALTLMDRLSAKPMRHKELAAFVGIKPSSLTKQIQELEAKGLVDRIGDEKDGRAAIIRLTRSGQDALASRRRDQTVDPAPGHRRLVGRAGTASRRVTRSTLRRRGRRLERFLGIAVCAPAGAGAANGTNTEVAGFPLPSRLE